MRINKILYFTSNKIKFDLFQAICIKGLSDAIYQGISVKVLDSFYHDKIKGDVPLFNEANNLSLFFSEYPNNLSDLIVIIDIQQIANKTGDDKILRNIIIEYPEIKFLFDQNPQWKLFKKSKITLDVRNSSTETCKFCLELLKNNTEHRKVKESFISAIKDCEGKVTHSNFHPSINYFPFLKFFHIGREEIKSPSLYESDAWALLRKFVRTNNEYILDDIRDLRKNLISKIAVDFVDFDMVTINIESMSSNLLKNIVQGYDNLFDASNLRYAIKQWKYADIDVHSQNLRSTQESRRDNLAICVEEEREQNRFNSYCLFANGYRVLPITSAVELMRINDRFSDEETTIKPSLIVRDYDLQFPDQHEIPSTPIDAIDQIRGYRFHEESEKWDTYICNSKCWSSFYDSESNQEKGYSKIPILFISKGGKNVDIEKASKLLSNSKSGKHGYISYYINRRFGVFEPRLHLPGIQKPISGIYRKFFEVKQIKERYELSRKHRRKYMNTSRQGHEHGTSLDIYSLVKSIIDRARKYFDSGKYIHAAILSNEALEYLNGFHQSLMVEAYYINAVAENAISLDAMGVDEETLSEDALIRVHKIKEDVKRLYEQKGKKGWKKESVTRLSRNALNQIYSDCRTFCHDKEHFKAEDVFISAMGHINEKI